MTDSSKIKVGPTLTIKLDTKNLDAAIAKFRRALTRLGRGIRLSSHIPHQPPPIAGGRGAAYRARTRTRNRRTK